MNSTIDGFICYETCRYPATIDHSNWSLTILGTISAPLCLISSVALTRLLYMISSDEVETRNPRLYLGFKKIIISTGLGLQFMTGVLLATQCGMDYFKNAASLQERCSSMYQREHT